MALSTARSLYDATGMLIRTGGLLLECDSKIIVIVCWLIGLFGMGLGKTLNLINLCGTGTSRRTIYM